MLDVQPNHDKDNPTPRQEIEPNIRVSLHLRKGAAREYRLLVRIADPVQSFSGG